MMMMDEGSYHICRFDLCCEKISRGGGGRKGAGLRARGVG